MFTGMMEKAEAMNCDDSLMSEGGDEQSDERYVDGESDSKLDNEGEKEVSGEGGEKDESSQDETKEDSSVPASSSSSSDSCSEKKDPSTSRRLLFPLPVCKDSSTRCTIVINVLPYLDVSSPSSFPNVSVVDTDVSLLRQSVSLYYNGLQVSPTDDTKSDFVLHHVPTAHSLPYDTLRVGKAYFLGSGFNFQSTVSILEDFRVYDAALSEDDVKSIQYCSGERLVDEVDSLLSILKAFVNARMSVGEESLKVCGIFSSLLVKLFSILGVLFVSKVIILFSDFLCNYEAASSTWYSSEPNESLPIVAEIDSSRTYHSRHILIYFVRRVKERNGCSGVPFDIGRSFLHAR